MTTDTTLALTQIDYGWSEEDCATADKIAAELGYTQTVYTSSSSLWGLYCMRDSANDRKRGGCIIKTQKLGFLFVQTEEETLGYVVRSV